MLLDLIAMCLLGNAMDKPRLNLRTFLVSAGLIVSFTAVYIILLYGQK